MTKSKSASKSTSKSGSTTSKVANPKAKMASKEKATSETTATDETATTETTAPVKTPRTPKVKAAPSGPVIEILKAQYGIDGTRIDIDAKVGRKVTNKLAGSDPAPKVAKNLMLTAMVDGVEQTLTFNEGEFIKF